MAPSISLIRLFVLFYFIWISVCFRCSDGSSPLFVMLRGKLLKAKIAMKTAYTTTSDSLVLRNYREEATQDHNDEGFELADATGSVLGNDELQRVGHSTINKAAELPPVDSSETFLDRFAHFGTNSAQKSDLEDWGVNTNQNEGDEVFDYDEEEEGVYEYANKVGETNGGELVHEETDDDEKKEDTNTEAQLDWLSGFINVVDPSLSAGSSEIGSSESVHVKDSLFTEEDADNKPVVEEYGYYNEVEPPEVVKNEDADAKAIEDETAALNEKNRLKEPEEKKDNVIESSGIKDELEVMVESSDLEQAAEFAMNELVLSSVADVKPEMKNVAAVSEANQVTRSVDNLVESPVVKVYNSVSRFVSNHGWKMALTVTVVSAVTHAFYSTFPAGVPAGILPPPSVFEYNTNVLPVSDVNNINLVSMSSKSGLPAIIEVVFSALDKENTLNLHDFTGLVFDNVSPVSLADLNRLQDDVCKFIEPLIPAAVAIVQKEFEAHVGSMPHALLNALEAINSVIQVPSSEITYIMGELHKAGPTIFFSIATVIVAITYWSVHQVIQKSVNPKSAIESNEPMQSQSTMEPVEGEQLSESLYILEGIVKFLRSARSKTSNDPAGLKKDASFDGNSGGPGRADIFETLVLAFSDKEKLAQLSEDWDRTLKEIKFKKALQKIAQELVAKAVEESLIEASKKPEGNKLKLRLRRSKSYSNLADLKEVKDTQQAEEVIRRAYTKYYELYRTIRYGEQVPISGELFQGLTSTFSEEFLRFEDVLWNSVTFLSEQGNGEDGATLANVVSFLEARKALEERGEIKFEGADKSVSETFKKYPLAKTVEDLVIEAAKSLYSEKHDFLKKAAVEDENDALVFNSVQSKLVATFNEITNSRNQLLNLKGVLMINNEESQTGEEPSSTVEEIDGLASSAINVVVAKTLRELRNFGAEINESNVSEVLDNVEAALEKPWKSAEPQENGSEQIVEPRPENVDELSRTGSYLVAGALELYNRFFDNEKETINDEYIDDNILEDSAGNRVDSSDEQSDSNFLGNLNPSFLLSDVSPLKQWGSEVPLLVPRSKGDGAEVVSRTQSLNAIRDSQDVRADDNYKYKEISVDEVKKEEILVDEVKKEEKKKEDKTSEMLQENIEKLHHVVETLANNPPFVSSKDPGHSKKGVHPGKLDALEQTKKLPSRSSQEKSASDKKDEVLGTLLQINEEEPANHKPHVPLSKEGENAVEVDSTEADLKNVLGEKQTTPEEKKAFQQKGRARVVKPNLSSSQPNNDSPAPDLQKKRTGSAPDLQKKRTGSGSQPNNSSPASFSPITSPTGSRASFSPITSPTGNRENLNRIALRKNMPSQKDNKLGQEVLLSDVTKMQEIVKTFLEMIRTAAEHVANQPSGKVILSKDSISQAKVFFSCKNPQAIVTAGVLKNLSAHLKHVLENGDNSKVGLSNDSNKQKVQIDYRIYQAEWAKVEKLLVEMHESVENNKVAGRFIVGFPKDGQSASFKVEKVLNQSAGISTVAPQLSLKTKRNQRTRFFLPKKEK